VRAIGKHQSRIFVSLQKRRERDGAVGIAFDPEPYVNPWIYPNLPRAKEKSFKEYRQQVRKRGAQFIQALQQKLPGVKVLTLFQRAISQNSWMSLILRNGCVSFSQQSMAFAFLNGILDASHQIR